MKKLLLLPLLLFPFMIHAQWVELGTGANALNVDNYINAIATDAAGNVYAGGAFLNSNTKFYVAKWNGTFWAELGTGTQALNAYGGQINCIVPDANGNLYTAGSFTDANNKQYVAKWDGTTWSTLGTGSNALNANGSIYALCVDPSGNVYVAGSFKNASTKQYVAKWNGTVWVQLGGDFLSGSISDISSLAADANGNIYAAGTFTNANGKNYVAKWDGTAWSQVGGDIPSTSSISTMCLDQSGNVYVSSYSQNLNAEYYVMKYNGTSWINLDSYGLNASSYISKIRVDPNGYVYAIGFFENASSKKYVAKWDGTSWSELGTGANALNPNHYIYALHVDAQANVYVGGVFYDSNNKKYVAKWQGTLLPTASVETSEATVFSAYPNPSGGDVRIALPSDGLLQVFNASGKIMKTAQVIAGSYELNINNYASGMYTVLLTSSNTSYTPLKIIKE
jgi:hypothetical protein